ncbi:hypothetical protein BKI52_15565 [marine bacterium AO1-C]|nr:hypothetical protein BKI52_15565 [marine bacterium AO1-C]
MKKYCINLLGITCCLVFLGTQTANSQNFLKRYINSLVNDTADVSKPQFITYPILGYAPETSLEIGLNSLLIYYAKRDTTNRLSEVNAFTFFTLENQYGFWFDHALYSHKDNWFFLGRIRLQSFPLLYYGIGLDTPKEHIARVDANQILVKERILRKLHKNVFLGLEIDFQQLSNLDFVENEGRTLSELPLGHEGSTNIGFGLGLVYDNRHNVLNVRDGFFSEIAFLHYNSAISTFGFNSVSLDSRIYRPIGKNNVFAAQLLGQFNSGDVPFNQLALMGGESMMRGYYTGRYRDKNQVAAQAELRFLPLPLGFSKRIGFTVFGSVATVADRPVDLRLNDLIWSAGVGLRFLLFKKKDIYTRIDYAVNAETTGLYIFIGEAF